MEQLAYQTVRVKHSTFALFALSVAGFGLILGLVYWLLPSAVERLSLRLTVTLGLEVTLLCLLLAPLPLYAVFRYSSNTRLQKAVLAVAMIAFLVPTIARSLVISALCSYYGPIATLLRWLHLWSENVPLDSSHLAVGVSLVTLYLPITIIVMAEGIRGLGRMPDTAITLGASPFKLIRLIILPGLRRSGTIAGLLVFSQVLGVIVTPRILGSNDVTLAILIDDFLKRQLNTGAALRVALAEFVLALPIAIIAAHYLHRGLRSARATLRPRDNAEWGGFLSVPLLLILLALPAGLILLSIINSNVLSLDHIITHGLTFHWFTDLWSDAPLLAVIWPSVATWTVATVITVGGGTLLAFFSLGHPRWCSVLEWMALVSLFIPQNVLAVLFSAFLDSLGVSARMLPAWLLAGFGQALPTLGVAIILVNRSLQSVESKLKVAATLGASPLTRLRFIVLPNIGTAIGGSLVAVTLVTLDDILFVRYLPGQTLNTFATEMFARARYSSSPELAAAAVAIISLILLLAALVVWASSKRVKKKIRRFLPFATEPATE